MDIFLKTPLDFWLITKVLEPLTQKIQRWTGLDCFFWAKSCFVFAIITGCIRTIVALIGLATVPPSSADTFIETIMLLSVVVLTLWNKRQLTCREQGLPLAKELGYEAVKKGCKNPFLLDHKRHFFLWALVETCTFHIVIVSIINGSTILFILLKITHTLFVVSSYLGSALMACTPLPPQKSKLREGLEKLKELLTPTPADEGLPAPAGA